MSEVNKYIILFQGRAGSTFLTEHTCSHPSVRAMYEEFADVDPDWNSQLDWMSQFYFAKRGKQIKAVGFKTKLTQVADPDLFSNFIEDNNIKVIHLYRRNLAKLIISIIRADELRRRYGGSNLYPENKSLGKIKISVDEFRRYKCRTRIYRELKEYVNQLNTDVCHVNYEQLLYRRKGTLNRIWDFLGVERIETEARVVKNTPDQLSDAVENLDELRASFPEYDRFFDEEFDRPNRPEKSLANADSKECDQESK